MTEPRKIISPTGLVHISDTNHGSYSSPLCVSHPYVLYSNEIWRVTYKAVTCRRCLARSKDPMNSLKCLAMKAEDMNSDFHGLAKRFCSFFSLKSRDYNPIALRICSHRRRLGTEKNPKFCNLLDCPLKYER